MIDRPTDQLSFHAALPKTDFVTRIIKDSKELSIFSYTSAVQLGTTPLLVLVHIYVTVYPWIKLYLGNF